MEKGPAILVVDDEPDVARYIGATLSRHGYKSFVAESGRQALHLFHLPGRSIDLVVTDIVMHDVAGPTLVKALRETNPHIRVIYMSGYGREHLQTYGDELAGYEVLPKPFTPSELLAAVARATGRVAKSAS